MSRKRSPRRMIPEGEHRIPVAKAIGMPELDAGGKLLPLQRPGDSGVLPNDKDPKLPTDGLIVSPARLAEAVLDSRKTLVIKTRPFEIAGKRCLLIGDDRKALGIVKIGKLRDMDLAEMNRTVDQHLVSDDLRAEWAKTQKSWKKGPFYGWTVAVETKFDAPAETNIGPGPQVLARDVELEPVEKQIHTDPTRLFFCVKLPDEIRKKLTALAGDLLEGIDSALDPDDADHITVLYVPSKGEYSEGDKKDAISAIQKVLDAAKPIDAKLQGWGYFDGVSKDGEAATVLVALVDAPGLADLHVEIKAALSEAGFTEVDDQTHGFVPHATLAYLPVGTRVENLPVLDAAFKIEKIELVHSDINGLDLRGIEKQGVREIKPATTIKRVDLKASMDTGAMTTAELTETHWRLHQLHRDPAEAWSETGYSLMHPDISMGDASNLHALVVDELFDRKIPHPPPPGDGMDDVSEDFERHEDRQPSHDVPPWEKVRKRSSEGEYAKVHHSGAKRGRKITLEEVLPYFKTFKLRKPYVYLVGGLANNGSTEGDIDVLVQDAEDLPEELKHAIHFRLGRALPPELSERLEVHWDEFHTPFTNFVELFDLTAERVNPENEIKLMRKGTVVVEKVGPFKRWGGSARYATRLASNLPIHKRYIEPFAGAASLLFAKKPAEEEILSDLDGEIVHAFKMIKGANEDLIERLEKKDRVVSEAKFREFAKNIPSGSVDRLHRFLFVQGASYSGSRNGPPPTERIGKVAYDPARLLKFRDRLKKVKIVHADYRKILKKYDDGETLFFLDPPYPGEWAKDKDDIGDERSNAEIDLDEFVDLVKRLKGKWIAVLGDSTEQKKAIRETGGKTFSYELAESTGRGTKTARRYFATNLKKLDKQEARAAGPELRSQADPYMEYPDEDKAPYDYVVQEHFRGKGLHADFRIGYRPGKLLIGWTMNTQIAGAIKEPVTTLKQAQQLAKTRMNQYSKINWHTGEWAERPKRGTTKLVRTSILCERKAPSPWAWLDVAGKTKDPEPGKPPPVGGTKNFPGVFNIVDRGDVEFGSQKQQFHEYFFTEGSLKGRLIFRQLRILPAKKGTHSRSRCMHEGCKRAPDVDVLWADGRGRVWFCTEHLAAWKQGFKDRGEGDWLEIVGEKKVTSGEVPEKWSDVHKSENIVVGKELVLPPSEEQDLPGPAWLAIKPDDQTPYVLDGDAVKKNWMPPVGVSALPRAIREQVPEEYRYWQQKTAAKAKQARDALVLAIKANDVTIDYSAPYGRITTKASMTDARFVLQEQTWQHPVWIWNGPSRTLWHLRLDVGRPELIVVDLYLNPLDNKRLAAQVTDDPHKDSMKLQGAVRPSHYLNPTKTTPSNIEIMDSGKASVLAYSDKYLKVRLDGELLGGPYEASRSDGDWLWQPSEPDQKVEKEAGDMEDEYRAEFVTQASIAKVDKEKRLVTGIVLEPNTVDAQGDTIDVEAIERAAHRFLSRYNRETQLGVLHTIFGENGVELVESWTAKTDFKLGGQNVTEGTWLMTNKVVDDALWKKVKAGEITGFSIGGVATVV